MAWGKEPADPPPVTPGRAAERGEPWCPFDWTDSKGRNVAQALAEFAPFLGQLQGLAFPLVEAFGVGQSS